VWQERYERTGQGDGACDYHGGTDANKARRETDGDGECGRGDGESGSEESGRCGAKCVGGEDGGCADEDGGGGDGGCCGGFCGVFVRG
jgi:hypothetical protein